MKSYEILELLNTSFFNEYKELSDLWKEIEKKARINSTISGVLLALIFGIFEKFKETIDRYFCIKVIIYIIIISTIISLLSSIFSLLSKKIKFPILGTKIYQNINDIIDKKKLDVLYKNYLNDICKIWNEANVEYYKIINNKSIFVSISHFSLLISIVFIFIICSLILFIK
jgi:hypothetical protein